MTLCQLHVSPLPCQVCELNERKWDIATETQKDAAPTPHTDALIARFAREEWFDVDDALNLARQLERELAARNEQLRQSCDEYRAEHGGCCASSVVDQATQVNVVAECIRAQAPATTDPGIEKLLRTLLDRAYKMLMQAGYRVMDHDPDHNDPIIAWMSDARLVLYGSTKQEPMGWL